MGVSTSAGRNRKYMGMDMDMDMGMDMDVDVDMDLHMDMDPWAHGNPWGSIASMQSMSIHRVPEIHQESMGPHGPPWDP